MHGQQGGPSVALVFFDMDVEQRAGVDIDPLVGTGREVCEKLMARGVLAKDTHGSTIRLAPPIVISEATAVTSSLRSRVPCAATAAVARRRCSAL